MKNSAVKDASMSYGASVKKRYLTLPSKWSAIVSAALALSFSSSALAHPDFEIDGVIGARIGGSVTVTDNATGREGRVSANSSLSYGGLFGYRLQPNGFIYLSYSRQQTELRYRQSGAADISARQDASIEYFQFGGYIEADRGKLFPYLGFSVGAGRFATLGTSSVQEWRFSGVLDGGLKYQILPYLHLRLLARMPITILTGDARVFCISSAGCVASYSGTPLLQGEFQGGIGFTF